MIKIGEYNLLEIIGQTDNGFYLGDDQEDVLIPNKFIKEEWKIGDKIEVFVYLDSEERKIATTEEPLITVGEFAGLTVAQNTNYGSFLEWGVVKQLFVPFKEQAQKLEEGRKYVFYMYIDQDTDRLVASSKLNKFLKKKIEYIKEGDRVSLHVYAKTNLGYKVIVNGKYDGLIFNSDITQNLEIGQFINKGYIKQIREDGKLDITLQQQGYRNFIEPNTKMLLELLEKNSGKLNLNDKSSPESIRSIAKMSKKNFKKAVGALYKKKLIKISDSGIEKI